MSLRMKLSTLVAEMFGTAILTSTVLAESNSNVLVNRTWFVAATAGITMALMVIVIGKVSGAHINPAVTIGLWTLRKIETTTAIAYVAAQVLGAAVALRLYQYLQNDALQNIAGKFEWRMFVAEVVGTFIFTFGIAAVVTQKFDGYKAAFGIGASLMLGIVVAGTASNGILNPAVALGLNSWSWIYAAGPIVGSVLGMNMYDLFVAPDSAFKTVATNVKPSTNAQKPVKKANKKK
jgi:glycerol uptake facilitator-like aquaporin